MNTVRHTRAIVTYQEFDVNPIEVFSSVVSQLANPSARLSPVLLRQSPFPRLVVTAARMLVSPVLTSV